MPDLKPGELIRALPLHSRWNTVTQLGDGTWDWVEPPEPGDAMSWTLLTGRIVRGSVAMVVHVGVKWCAESVAPAHKQPICVFMYNGQLFAASERRILDTWSQES